MTIDLALLSVGISLIMAMLAGGVVIGRALEKIKSNRLEIEENKKDAIDYRKENREEHKVIVERLDKLILEGSK